MSITIQASSIPLNLDTPFPPKIKRGKKALQMRIESAHITDHASIALYGTKNS